MIRITESNENVPDRMLWDFLFFLSQGIITILIVPVAGVLLAYGFLMIPAAIGVIFTRRWPLGLLIGWTSGMAACLLGLFFSYGSDSPYGPSLVLAMGLFFLVALAVRGLLSTTASRGGTA
jgi:zinc/manganese transport system permease protein